MRPMTDAQFWACAGILLGGIALLVFAFLVHWRKVDNDILAEERRKLKRQAEEYAEKLAEKRFREYIASVQINFRPTLINESDIDWGDD